MGRYLKREKPIARPCQGDIYSDIHVNGLLVSGETEEFEITDLLYTHAIVVTQECDLLQDYSEHQNQVHKQKQDKYIPSILLLPAYLAQSFREGKHLEDINLIMERHNSNKWGDIKKNNVLRYHYLQSAVDFNVPELVIDFKHYFTILRDVFYSIIADGSKYIASLDVLYREEVSYRFGHYLARIGTPAEVEHEAATGS